MQRKISTTICLLLAFAFPGAAGAQCQLLADQQPPSVFAGDARKIPLTWHNPGDQIARAGLLAQLWQTSSATAIRLGDTPWKTLEVLPRQTVLESAQLDFPPVRAKTKFLVQWLAGTNQVIATTEVWVYPTNLLEQLQTLAAPDDLGIFDPLNQLKPLLKNLKVKFADLEKSDLKYFPGRLAIIGPFATKTQMPENLALRIKQAAKKNIAIVWLQPPPDWQEKLTPSFYSVPEKKTAVVVVAPELVAGLAENPQSQLNLIFFCQLALKPEPLSLPNLSLQP